MDQHQLGRTDLQVSRLSLGGLFVSGVGGNNPTSTAAILRRAAELGITYIDTAPTYGNSEEVLGAALADVDASFLLSTKLGGGRPDFDPKNPGHLRSSLENSLKLLGRDSVDLLMIHEADRPGQYDWWDDIERFEGAVNDVLDQLKAEGVVRYTGLGGTTAYELAHLVKTGRYDVVLTAYNYSLLWTEAANAVVPAATKLGLGIVAGSPLQQGALAVRHDDLVKEGRHWLSPARREQYLALYALCDDLNISLPDLALRFVVSNPAIHTTLNGARSVAELEASVAAVEQGPLPDDVLARLAEIAAIVPFRPCEEPFNLPFTKPYRGPGRAR